MFRCAAFLFLLVLTWAEQANSTPCKHEYPELFALLDKCQAAILGLVQSPEHKSMIEEFHKKMKAWLCEMQLDEKVVEAIKRKKEEFLKKLETGEKKAEDIIKFLDSDPVKNFDKFVERMMEKFNIKA